MSLNQGKYANDKFYVFCLFFYPNHEKINVVVACYTNGNGSYLFYIQRNKIKIYPILETPKRFLMTSVPLSYALLTDITFSMRVNHNV